MGSPIKKFYIKKGGRRDQRRKRKKRRELEKERGGRRRRRRETDSLRNLQSLRYKQIRKNLQRLGPWVN